MFAARVFRRRERERKTARKGEKHGEKGRERGRERGTERERKREIFFELEAYFDVWDASFVDAVPTQVGCMF